MDVIQKQLLGYWTNLTQVIHPVNLTVDIITCTLLSLLVAKFYVRYGNALSNRKKFSQNFVPLALTTMAIMIIVKPSIALSLGLVGALSIVRFRAAIKDPEELTYLFLIIGIGLATGADQPLIAIIIIVFVLLFLTTSKFFSREKVFRESGRTYINIQIDSDDLEKVEQVANSSFKELELRRVSFQGETMDISFMCKGPNAQSISMFRKELLSVSAMATFTVVDQPDLIV